MKVGDSNESARLRLLRSSRSSIRRSQRWFHPQLEMLELRCLLSIAPSTVVGRFAFYDNSHYDGNIPGINSSDGNAIAVDKSPLLSGLNEATLVNMTTYSRGINGIMVDISGSHPGITASDFTFRIGNNNAPNSWVAAPAPVSITVRAGGGVSGSDRVEILWADNAIQQEWLEVIVSADRNTGLGTSDVFFYGNEIGDSGFGDLANLAKVDSEDITGVQTHGASVKSNIPVGNVFDFNKDGLVDSQDITIAQTHGTSAKTGLQLLSPPSISPPALLAGLSNDTGSSNGDGITFDATVAGTLTAAYGITSFKAGLNNGPVTANVLPLVQGGGAFTINAVALRGINGGTLPDGSYVLHLRAVDAQGFSAALDLPFTLSTAAPTISVSTLASFTDDLTPHVTVSATDAQGFAVGAQVSLDVDLNNDGSFNGSAEFARTQAALYAGGAYFQLTPALPATDAGGGSYVVQLRARVTDIAGNQGYSTLQSLKIDTSSSTALQDYVNAPDPSYSYSLASTIVGSGYTAYIYNMISQTWRSTADVDKPVWQNWVTVVVPSGAINSHALLFIDSGANTPTPPTSVNAALVSYAVAFHSVTIDLPTVPNQPLVFTGDPSQESRTEDEIIAYTFAQYEANPDDPNSQSWPALEPMVKSAVKAMDTVQAVIPGLTGGTHVNDFVVTGYSKRGWTTWLTAAVDSRVIAIIPGVIDVLNMDEQMIHHDAFYAGVTNNTTDGFSNAIQDYVGYDIPEDEETTQGQDLGEIVDPYKYLNNGRFNIPKLEINSAGDEFFVPDSAQFYFSDLPGTQNYLRYLPNTGHGLNNTDPVNSTASFYNAVINNLPLPQFSWAVQPDGSIRVQTVTAPTNVVMWQATNPTARDFRHGYNPSIVYTSSPLADQGGGVYLASVPVPTTGATAFFVQLTFTSPLTGNPYIFTTEIKVASNIPLGAWPFYTATNSMMAPATADGIDLSAIASSLAAPAAILQPPPAPQPSMATTTADETSASTRPQSAGAPSIVDDWPWLEEQETSEPDSNSSNSIATDLVLASLSGDSIL